MRAQRVVWRNRLGNEVRTLRLHARIDMLAVIAVWPAIEGAILHRSHVVRHEVGTDLVTFIDHGPQRAALWLEGQAIRIAQAAGENTETSNGAIDLENGSAI